MLISLLVLTWLPRQFSTHFNVNYSTNDYYKSASLCQSRFATSMEREVAPPIPIICFSRDLKFLNEGSATNHMHLNFGGGKEIENSKNLKVLNFEFGFS